MTHSSDGPWPRISIVTPSFNQGRFLESTIRSVLDQQYPNLEYIIIDGGSTDNSVEIIEKYQDQLSFWCSEKDEGQYSAINKGFSHANGEIMAWLNSDDMYCPWALRTVGTIFREYEQVSWITTVNSMIFNWNGFVAHVKRTPGFSAKAFSDGECLLIRDIQTDFIQQESTFWRKSLWDKVGGISLEHDLAADFDLWAHFFEHDRLYGVVSPFAGFRSHDTNRSLDLTAYMNQAKKIIDRFRKQNPRVTNRLRQMFRKMIRTVPGLRQRVKIYQVENFYPNYGQEGKDWLLVKEKY